VELTVGERVRVPGDQTVDGGLERFERRVPHAVNAIEHMYGSQLEEAEIFSGEQPHRGAVAQCYRRMVTAFGVASPPVAPESSGFLVADLGDVEPVAVAVPELEH
jgi:hypothetical protein